MSTMQATWTTPSIRVSFVVMPIGAEARCLEFQGHNDSAGWPH